MRLASFTDYSLRVLIYLGLKKDELSTVLEISQKYNISRNHLVKVTHNLSLLGLIHSYKGKGGGIELAKEAKEINIGKIIRILESESALVECFSESGQCAINPSCKLKNELKKAQNQFYLSLENITLEDLLAPRNQLKKNLSLDH